MIKGGTLFFNSDDPYLTKTCQVSYHRSFVFKLITALLNFVVPVLVLIITNSKIYLLIRKRAKNLKASSSHEGKIHKSYVVSNNLPIGYNGLPITLRDKSLRNLFLIVTCFIVCFLPYFICYVIVAYCEDCVSEQLLMLTTWLGYLNSTFNPFIYALFRKAKPINRV